MCEPAVKVATSSGRITGPWRPGRLLSWSVVGFGKVPVRHRETAFLTVQRKLKDAGWFVFIDWVKGNTSLLPFVSRVLPNAREAFDGRPDRAEWQETVAIHGPEPDEAGATCV